MTKTITRDDVLNLIAKNDMAVYMGLLALYNRQTSDEINSEETKHLNGMGFNGRDGKFGVSLARQIIEWFATEPKNRTYGYPLSRTQLEKGRKMLKTYAKQLALVANERQEQEFNANEESRAADAEAKAEWEADIAAERYWETRNELAYINAGYQD